MKFEGRPLSACKRLVNASLALGMILAVSACSGGESEPEPSAETTPADSGQIIELSAVWSTSALAKPAADIALADGRSPFLAVAYEGGGLQLFDLDGEVLSETAPYTLTEITSGHEVEIDGARLNVFIGINDKTELHAYVFGEGLVAPVEVKIGSDPLLDIAGACASSASGSDGRLLNVGYWKTGVQDLLAFPVKAEGGELAWIDEAALVESQSAINACEFYDGINIALSENVIDGAVIDRAGFTGLITLQRSGALQVRTGTATEVQNTGGTLGRILVNNGLSVSMPEEPTSIAALGKPLAGGYGGGLIVVAGEVDGEEKIIFIAADALTGLSTNDADRVD